MTRHYDNQIIITISRAMRIELTAIAFHMGQKGMYSRPAKVFLQNGMDSYLAGLPPIKRAQYEEILFNVRALADQGVIKGVRSLAEFQKPKKPRKNKKPER